MVRRFISTAAVVACAGVYAFAAAERVTFILTNGERQSGAVAFHGDQHENLINGYLNIATSDKDMTFPLAQVGIIDFAGGTPPATELAKLGAGQMLVLRDSSTQQGRFVNMIGGDTLIWDTGSGQRQQFAIRDVTRVYLNPQTAHAVYNAPVDPSAPGTTPAPAGGTAVRVDARMAWNDTGIVVNAGERVVFNASGQIQFGRGAGQTSGPNGNAAERLSNYPDPTVPVGALIGRVGNGAPFGIGTQTQPLVMPSSGRLMLGVNDNEFSDNAGFFSVTVIKQ